MTKVNKFIYGWKFYSLVDGKWEYETFETTYEMMRTNRKAYRENSPYPLKITKGREPNDKYVPPDQQSVEEKLDDGPDQASNQ
jgi:hypothetical protein